MFNNSLEADAHNWDTRELEQTVCAYCGKPADAAMLVMGNSMAHDTCIIQKLNELLDPDFGVPNHRTTITVAKLSGYKSPEEVAELLSTEYDRGFTYGSKCGI